MLEHQSLVVASGRCLHAALTGDYGNLGNEGTIALAGFLGVLGLDFS